MNAEYVQKKSWRMDKNENYGKGDKPIKKNVTVSAAPGQPRG